MGRLRWGALVAGGAVLTVTISGTVVTKGSHPKGTPRQGPAVVLVHTAALGQPGQASGQGFRG